MASGRQNLSESKESLPKEDTEFSNDTDSLLKLTPQINTSSNTTSSSNSLIMQSLQDQKGNNPPPAAIMINLSNGLKIERNPCRNLSECLTQLGTFISNILAPAYPYVPSDHASNDKKPRRKLS